MSCSLTKFDQTEANNAHQEPAEPDVSDENRARRRRIRAILEAGGFVSSIALRYGLWPDCSSSSIRTMYLQPKTSIPLLEAVVLPVPSRSSVMVKASRRSQPMSSRAGHSDRMILCGATSRTSEVSSR